MALTIEQLATLHTGDNETRVVNITFDASYPNTGGTVGEPFVAADVGLRSIDAVIVAAGSTVATKHVVYTPSTNVLRVYTDEQASGITIEAANASDQSALTVTALIVGK